MARSAEVILRVLVGARPAPTQPRRDGRRALSSSVEALEVLTRVKKRVFRRQTVTGLAIFKGVALVGSVEVEGLGTQTCLPRAQEASRPLATPYRGHDLAIGVPDHIPGPVVASFERKDARGRPLRQRDELRVPPVAYGEA